MKFYSVLRKDVGGNVDWHRAPALAAMLLTLAATPAWASGPSGDAFQGIGYVSSTATAPGSSPFGFSADGTTIVGYGQDSSNFAEAFRWTTTGGMQTLGFLNSSLATPSSYGEAVNADGSVVVGYSAVVLVSQYNYQFEAFRWTSGGGMVGLGYLNSSLVQPYSTALGVNADGSVVVGASYYATLSGLNVNEAFRWTQAGGMAALGFISSAYAYPTSTASGVSGDGSIVVGSSSADAAGHTEAFRWSSGAGMVGLGYLNANLATPYSYANAISSDGSTIVGKSYAVANQLQAFSWTSAGGMVPLGFLSSSGTIASVANAVDANGAVIVGWSYMPVSGSNVQTGFRWTSATGMQSIASLLTNAAVSTTGWTLHAAVAVSGDGQFIVGSGTDPVGKTEAYLVRYIDATVATSTTPSSSPLAGLTTVASVQSSVNQLNRQRQTLMVQQHGFAPALLGDNQRIVSPDDLGAYGSAGSSAGGASGRMERGPLTLLGGIGMASENYGSVSMSDAVLLAAKLRYLYPLEDRLGLFGEAGGFVSQGGSYGFNRSYINGSGTATGTGHAHGAQEYGFVRLGVVWNATDDDEIAPSGEIGYQSLSTDAYDETLSGSNPFQAQVSGGVASMEVAKLRAQWTHKLTPTLDATLWGAVAQGFGATDNTTATVAGVGLLAPGVRRPLGWGEYGARATYRINDALSASAFVDGVTGNGADSRAHFGGALLLAF